ncbi:OLC1v1024576C1 [Oldenlandia corymbosa var. corymbosa]|uniref:OLC1v1024576C1 n=1 Tax=Oldenlandia corymbosa var. corymbosa TaxID=529605 RepID=A0AAV1C5Q7_OLDCO|nr:OLC1v1024576C1 [Oldenlandia corymbosa var. corymbosa]
MDLRDSHREFSTKAMPTFLTGAAKIWFDSLSPGSVTSYADLGQKLHVRFFSSKRAKRTIHDLSSVRQRRNESLGEYYERFTKELMMIDQVDDLVVRVDFVNGLSPFGAGAALRSKLTAKPPGTTQKLWEIVKKEIRTDESMKRAREAFAEGEKKAGKSEAKKLNIGSLNFESKVPVLTKTRKEILQIHKSEFKLPPPGRSQNESSS